MTQEWKYIRGYKGFYEVSNLGNVRSVDRTVIRAGRKFKSNKWTYKGRTLKPGKSKYLIVVLKKGNVPKTVSVHTLVAQAFLPAKEKGKQINHKDGNKHNPKVSNLEWVTPAENIIHSHNNLLRKWVWTPAGLKPTKQYARIL